MSKIKSNQNPFVDKFSWLLSAILSPFILLPLVILAFSWKLTANIVDFRFFSALALTFMLAIPGIFILWQVKTKKIDDLHIYKREQRMDVFLVFLISTLATIALFFYFDAPLKLTGLIILAFVSGLISGFITLWWKISIHMVALATTSVAYALLTQTPLAWATLIFIPLVAWSRVYRKRHTLAQTIAGTVLGATLSIIFYKTFLLF